MQVRNLLTDEDAVSPVIGVILMVAITVILAAVIASFVLGLGDTEEPAPNLVFDEDTNADGDELEITIIQGDSDADAELLEIVVDGDVEGTWSEDATGDGELSAGESITFVDSNSGNGEIVVEGSDEEVELIWDDDDRLQTFDVSDIEN